VSRRRLVGGHDDFEQLLANIGAILGIIDDDCTLGDGVMVPVSLDVAAIRHKTGLSQAAFTRRIGVAVRTIHSWERGHRSPAGPARILLALLDRNPKIIDETLAKQEIKLSRPFV
jgi:putative transcriptional regulator